MALPLLAFCSFPISLAGESYILAFILVPDCVILP